MRRFARVLLPAALAIALAACSDDEAEAPAEPQAEVEETRPAECTTDQDCEAQMVCLAGACTKAAAGAIYTDPSNAVTPDKVQGDLEQRGAQHGENIDKALEAE